MKIIERPVYIKKIEQNFTKDRIIILTGQRRVGKSYLLRSLKEKLKKEDRNNVIFIDKEKKDFDELNNYHDLNSYIDQNLKHDCHNYILIDEIQEIEGFEYSLRAYYEEENIELVVTGSNSSMLSSELATKIGGRYKEIYIQSLSYIEFLKFHNLDDDDDSLNKYLIFGGLPGLIRTGLNEDEALEYQNDVLNTVVLKDIILRHKIRNVSFLQNLLHYLADNTGKLISASNISKFLKGTEFEISSGAIINYIDYICQAFVLKKVARYDIHGKRLFEINNKYYFQDIGIRNSLIRGVRMFDIEKVIENVVYNYLIFKGYEVNIGQLRNNKEIDFIIRKNGKEPIYIQVAYLIANELTYQREYGNLREIKDNHPKYVISMSPGLEGLNDGGIKHLSLRKFLKMDSF